MISPGAVASAAASDTAAAAGRDPEPAQRLVMVTGLSGAGRTTAINALADLGFEVIDGMPLSLIPRLFEGPPLPRPLVLGIDTRTRGFSAAALGDLLTDLAADPRIALELLFLEASPDALLRRYSETRRRHPAAPAEDPRAGIARETDLLAAVRARADVLIDTSEMSPHDLRAEMTSQFAPPDAARLAVTIQSFSYRRGIPRGADVVLDCRFLNNPYWQERLRHKDGRDPDVAAYVRNDPRFNAFFERLAALVALLLPAHAEEGKSHFGIALGCTGGQHRSVCVTEMLAETLAADGWQVSKRHRELEGRAADGAR